MKDFVFHLSRRLMIWRGFGSFWVDLFTCVNALGQKRAKEDSLTYFKILPYLWAMDKFYQNR